MQRRFRVIRVDSTDVRSRSAIPPLTAVELSSLISGLGPQAEQPRPTSQSFPLICCDDVLELPALVEKRLGRPVESEDRKPALAGNGPDPVLLLFRLLGPEDDVDRAVGIDRRLAVAA